MKSLLSSILLLMLVMAGGNTFGQCGPGEDTTPPTCSQKDTTLYLDGAGMVSVDPALLDDGSTDNCPGPLTFSLDQSSFDCTDVGANIVHFTVEDASGNTSSCDVTITVLDTISPICVSGTAVVTLFVDIAQVVNGEFVDEGSTDNCEIDTFIISPDTFDCDDVGANPVTFTTFDVNGNSCSSVGEVLVVEKIKPICVVKDITVNLDAAGMVSIVPADVDDGTFDPCGIIDFYSVTPNSFDCTDLGTNTVTFVAQDTSDNFCSTTANVFVRQPITCSVNNPTAYFNSMGVAAIQVSDVDNGSSLICGGALNLSLDQFVFNCQASFSSPTTVYLIHDDGSGILDSCASQVTLLDTLSPVCETPYEVTIYLDNAGMATAPTFDKDVVGSDNCELSTAVLSKTDFTCSDIGLNNETILLTDVYGNTTNCPASITVLDTIAPICTVQDVTLYVDASGMAVLDSAAVDNGSTDLCGMSSLDLSQSDFDCDDLGMTTVVVTVTDAGGNTSTCESQVTVLDTITPICNVFDITVYVDGSGMVSIDSSDVDNGSSDNCTDFTLELSPTDFDCTDLGISTVTITVTDGSGNSSSCNSLVTVLDTISPICITQNVTVFVDGTGNASITAADIDNGSTDNCMISSLDASPTSFDCDDVGMANAVILTVTDNSGNTSTCTSNVSVMDTISPVCMANDVTIYLDNSGAASITTGDIDNGSSDNCAVQSLALDISSFDCDDLGDNQVTLTVTDVNTNTSSCMATVTVLDTISPICNVMDLTVYLDGSGMVSIDSSDLDNGSSDNCLVNSLDISDSDFTCVDAPTQMVTITVSDNSGNSSTCSANITILDTIPPTCVAQDVTVYVNGAGNASILTSDIDNGSSDNCGPVMLALNETDFDCSELGANTVILTVTDNSSNTSTCEATVTVLDTIAPLCSVIDITVDLDAMGMATIDSSDVNNGSSDNCMISTISLDNSMFDCTDIGDNDVIVTVTDDSGNSTTCVSVVTIEDNLDVICMVQDITVYLDVNGMVSIDSMDVDNGSSDNCGSLNLDLDITDFTCDNIGTNTVTVTVTDMNGNMETCQAMVEVLDTIAPICDVNDLTIYLDASGMASIDSSSIDNNSSDNCDDFTLELSQESFVCANVGANTIIVTTTDSQGNVSTCESSVTVLDTIPPDCLSQDISIFLDGMGSASIVAADVDGGSTDNCSIMSLSIDNDNFDCDDLGANTVILTVTDASNNSSQCSAVVTVIDTISPICMVQNLDVYLDNTGNASIDSSDVDNGSSDNCSAITLDLDITDFQCVDVGMNTVTVTVTDESGNTSICTLVATVQDTVAPICNVNDLTIYLDGIGNVAIDSSDVNNGSSDNCIDFTLDLNETDFNCDNIGVNTVVVTTTDAYGNSSTCESIVTVLDTISPICMAQDITVQLDASGMVNITTGDIDNGSADACNPLSLSLDQTSFDCTEVGLNVVVLTVTDANSNTSTCTANVTVQDTLSVMCMVQDVTIYLDGTGMASIDSSLVDNGSSDNCTDFTLDLDATDFDCTVVGANTVIATVTDSNSNSSSCSLVVTVLDTIKPMCDVANITVYLDAAGMASIDSTDIDVSSGDNCPDWTLDLAPKDFDCSNIGNNTISITVTDASGNISTCESMVMVLDTIAPSCMTQDITVQLDANGTVDIEASDIDNGSTDVCVPVSLSLDQTSFDCTEVGLNMVILTVTDANNNSSTCSANVTIQDTMSVMCMVQDVTVYLDGSGMVSIDSTLVDNGSSDNCSTFTLELDNTDFDCTNVGANTVTATVTDANGNMSICTLTATVLDTINPICDVQNLTIFLDNMGMVSIDSSDVDVSSGDNCPGWTMSLDNEDFTCDNVGNNIVTITVEDANGNQSICTSNVLVQDTISPICVAQDITVQLDNSGNVSITTADIDNGSSDNCGPVTLALDITDFDCSDVGANTVTLTVTDANSNSSQCTANVTVQDTMQVMCMVQDVTVYLDGSGMVSIDSTLVDNGSSDNCTAFTLELDNTDYDCTNIGANTVIATVTDANGNTSTCTLVATVLDTISPMCSVNDLTVYLDGSGMVSIDSTDIDLNSGDNCPDWTLDLSLMDFTCTDVGANDVLVTVTDASGNISTCESIVTVLDTIAPTCVTQDITVQLDANGMIDIAASDIDNGSADICVPVTLSLDQVSFDCTEVGINMVILTVTDANNNTSTCTANVTVQDTMQVMCMVQDVTVYLDGSGMVSIDSTLVDNGSSDNCTEFTLELDNTDFDCTNVGGNTVIATVTDANGNMSTCTLTATVLDTISPICDVQNLTIFLDNMGMVSIDSSDVDVSSGDNCPGWTLSLDNEDFTCDNVGNNIVTITVEDANGNQSICTSNVLVQDTISPICVAQDITVQLDNSGNASITATDIDNGSSDNCGPVTLALDITDFDCSDVGGNTVTLTVTDANNNTSQCTSTVTVQDTMDVMCMVQDITIYLDDMGMISIDSSDVDNGSSDNCDVFTLDIDISNFDCEDIGPNTVIATVTDVNGNMGTCTLTATVLDTMKPICDVQDITIYLDDMGMISIDSSSLDVNSSDNCNDFTLDLSDTSFDCTDIGVKTVVVTTTDKEGNESTCEAFVMVLDSMRPLCMVQDVTVYLDDLGMVSIDSSDVDNGSSDNCGGINLDLSPSEFTCQNVGPNIVTVTTTDDSGNVSTCLSTVVVIDSIVPICNVVDVTIYLDENGMVSIDSSDVDNSTMDNCIDYTLDLDVTDFDCSNVGPNLVTVTVTDANSNVSTCTLEAVVLDTLSPICLAQNIDVYLDENGLVEIDSSSVDMASSDNCNEFTLGVSPTSFNCDEVGDNTVVITTTDKAGNVTICETIVTVNDTIDPICMVQDISIYLDDMGMASIDSSDVDTGSSDNCNEFTLELGQTDFDCTEVGVVPVTITLTDKNGNITTCISEVTVLDTTKVECNVMDVLVYLDDMGQAVIDSADVDAGSMDNCSSYTLKIDNTDFECDDIGSNTIIVTTTDDSGNQSTCEAEVMVQDTTRPICMVQDITVYLDEMGEVSVTAGDVDAGSSDNCSLLATLLSQQNFDCGDEGVNELMLNLIDHSNNSNQCPVNVTVLDTLVPICMFNNPTVTLGNDGTVSIDSTDVDAGSSDNCGAYTIDIVPDEFDCSNIGINIVTVTLTDAYGNSKTGTIEVTVEGIPTPQIECPEDITILCTEDVSNLTVFGEAEIIASCGGTVTIDETQEIDLNECGIGTITRRFIANETGVVAGSDTCFQVITIINNDSLSIDLISAPMDTSIYDCSAGTDLTGMLLIDDAGLNCTNISIDFVDDTIQTICPLVINRTFTVIDSCNTNSGSYQTFEFIQSITVLDTMAPMLTCPSDVTVDAPMTDCEVEVSLVSISVDNCSNVEVTNDSPYAYDSGADATGLYPVGTTTVNFTAIDTCGNTSTCAVDITVEATMPLTCDLNDLLLRFPTSNVDETIVIDSSDLDLTITTCFDIVSIELSENTFNCTDSNSEITVTITDATGAVTTCTADVLIESSCINFNDQEPTAISTNGTMGIANVLDIWDTQCASLQYSEGGNGLSQDSAFLHVYQEICSVDGVVFTDDDFNGNLGVSSDGVVICYDLAILNGENSTGDGIATFMIYAGNDPLSAEYSAVFEPTSIQVSGDGFVQVCAPLALSETGVLPSNADGMWTMVNGEGASAWDSLILNVSGIAFDIDEIPTVDEYGIDNICIRNLDATNPVITCPDDLEILCSEIEETTYGTVDIGINCMMDYYIDTMIVSNIDVCSTGEMMRTYTVVDELGNSSSCTQTVILNPPAEDYLDAPEEIVIFLDGSQCNDTLMLPPAMINKFACGTAIDIVTSINGVDMIGNGGEIDLPAGIFPLVYSAIDECGNVSVVQTIVKLLRPCDLSVHASLNVSLDESCTGDITPEMLATFPVVCGDYYTVTLVDENGDPIPGNMVTKDHVGTQISFELSEPNCGNAAFGVLNIEDKYPPVIACQSDTIMCGAPIVFPDPIITEFCGEVEIIILDESVESTACVDDEIETIYTRTVQAIDESGNTSEICTQTLSILKFLVDSIKAPELFNIEIECNTAFPMDDVGNPDPVFYGGPLANGIDIFANPGLTCSAMAIYDDKTLELPLETAIVRTWTVFYWSCTVDTSLTYIQLFKFIDTQGPEITCPENITVASNAVECSADLFLPPASVSDLCSSVDRIDLSYDGMYVEDGNGAGANLPMGDNVITYIAFDALGNTSECSFVVRVEDQDAPTAICDQFTTVPLPLEGFVDVDASVFDDGSYDYCGIEKLEVRRMDPVCDATDINFGETIRVCCEDIGNEVMVVMRVTDQSGNTNECMVIVEVQDKLAPQLLADLPDITVSCEFPITEDNLSIFGTVVDDETEREEILLTAEYVAFSAEALDAFVLDNCITIINDEISETELNACGLGYVMRSITIEDGEGNELTLDQRIDRINVSPFTEADIIWPLDYDATNICTAENLNPEDLPEENGFPILSNTLCDQVGYTYEDSFIDQSQGDEACFKIIRNWEVGNWCQDVGGTFEKFYYQQIIKVTNTVAPELTASCEPIEQCSYDPNCGPAYVELINNAVDDCTDSSNLEWNYYIDLFSDNQIDESGTTNNASGTYPVGLHTIMWSVNDQCGNATACSYTFEIQNCKLPTAYCLDNITADLTPMDLDGDGEIDTEMLILKPYMIDAGSSQSCNQSVQLSFSGDVTDTIRTYDCEDIGLQQLALWVTDENGNQSNCTTSIDVQDNNDVDFCANTLQVDIVGTVLDPKSVMMEEVELMLNSVEGIMTDEYGDYAFMELLASEVYTVEPSKEDEAINGVSTLDIVMIQKYLLGLEDFTPYQILAADVDQSEQVTGGDLINIRRLLLGVYDDFPDTDPWRFYMNENGFVDETNPWATDLHEMYNNMTESDVIVDFTGVKMGDVNYSADVNGLTGEEAIVRSSETLLLSEKELNIGEERFVQVFLGQAQNIHGFQLEFEADEHISFLDIVEINNIQNLDYKILDNGKRIRVLDYNPNTRQLGEQEGLFSVKIKANQAISHLADHISLAEHPRVRNELYKADLSIHEVRLENRSKDLIEENLISEFSVEQNQPNPWKEETMIHVIAPKGGVAVFRVIDMNGKIIYERKIDIMEGKNEIKLSDEDILARGVLYYSVELNGSTVMKKMLVLE